MFTGIIEKSVRVIGVADGPMFRRLTLVAPSGDLQIGQSVAINGVCLTVAELGMCDVIGAKSRIPSPVTPGEGQGGGLESAGDISPAPSPAHPRSTGGGSQTPTPIMSFIRGLAPREVGFDVIQETLDKTNLGLLKAGDEVHIERALRMGDRLDGHLVQGHVDGVATLVSRDSSNEEFRLRLKAPSHLAKYLSPKGSVALDGVSLTIAAADGDEFEVALIPTTLQLTMLGRRDATWLFNLEVDTISKTVVSWLERRFGSAEDSGGFLAAKMNGADKK